MGLTPVRHVEVVERGLLQVGIVREETQPRRSSGHASGLLLRGSEGTPTPQGELDHGATHDL